MQVITIGGMMNDFQVVAAVTQFRTGKSESVVILGARWQAERIVEYVTAEVPHTLDVGWTSGHYIPGHAPEKALRDFMTRAGLPTEQPREATERCPGCGGTGGQHYRNCAIFPH